MQHPRKRTTFVWGSNDFITCSSDWRSLRSNSVAFSFKVLTATVLIPSTSKNKYKCSFKKQIQNEPTINIDSFTSPNLAERSFSENIEEFQFMSGELPWICIIVILIADSAKIGTGLRKIKTFYNISKDIQIQKHTTC